MRSDPVTAFDKVLELASVVGAVLHERLAERGLTPVRAGVLFALHQHGPMVQRELSEVLRCTPRHVTALIDVLETRGWVARRPHPTDRRATLVVLTDNGSAAATRMGTERQDTAHALFGSLPATDLAGFVAVADRVLHQFGASTQIPATPTDRPPLTPGGTPDAGTRHCSPAESGSTAGPER